MDALLFLWINAVLYIGFGIWCFLHPTTTSNFVGFSLLHASGKSEFLAVYAGLELGLGLFFLACTQTASLTYAGILFGTLMYSGINFFRFYSIFRFGMVSRSTLVLVVLEVTFCIWGWLLIANMPSPF